VSDLARLRKRVEEVRRNLDRTTGALEQVREQLREKYQVGSLRRAQRLLQCLKKKQARMSKDLDAEARRIEEEYKDVLD
jgi:hypothetical protein